MRKSILIVGAGAGIGKEVAILFAVRGYRLALADMNMLALTAVQEELNSLHPQVREEIEQLDITDYERVGLVFDACLTAWVDWTLSLPMPVLLWEVMLVMKITLPGH